MWGSNYIDSEHRLSSSKVWILRASTGRDILVIKCRITESLDIDDLGELNHYLGKKFTRSYESIKIDQSTYARDVVNWCENLLSWNLDKTYTIETLRLRRWFLQKWQRSKCTLCLGFHTKCYWRFVVLFNQHKAGFVVFFKSTGKILHQSKL